MANYNFTYNDGRLFYKDADGNECEISSGGSGDSNQLIVLVTFSDTRTTLTKTWNEIHEKMSAGVPCWYFENSDDICRLIPFISINHIDGAFFVSTYDDTFGTDDPDGYPYMED